jgi:hypothetical protein
MRWRLLVAVLGIGALSATAAMAQGYRGAGAGSRRGSMARGFDPATVTTISGEVLAVNSLPAARGSGIHMDVKTENDVIDVHLGPSWFLDQQKTKIAQGDAIEVTGSKVTLSGKPALVAQTVKKGSDVLALRDAAGVPAWAGQRRR